MIYDGAGDLFVITVVSYSIGLVLGWALVSMERWFRQG